MGLRDAYITRMGGYLVRGLLDHGLPALRAAANNPNFESGRSEVGSVLFGDRAADPERERLWWERPGLGLMFQVEARPGWQWQRNFDKFNASLRGPDSCLVFEGPLPHVSEWVDFSRRLGCDYHVFEAKWHDGICYWDTQYTEWKTPDDYCRAFAEESRAAGIPFGFYYSAVFDHNPDFDAIQPLRRATPSFLGMRGEARELLRRSLGMTQAARLLFWAMRRRLRREGVDARPPRPWFDQFKLNDFEANPARYIRYVLDQLEELCDEFAPDLLWIDWFDATGAAASQPIMSKLRKDQPRVALTFNQSIDHDLEWAHYLCGEAHGVRSTWKRVSKLRNMRRPWELVSPAAANWDAPQPKTNALQNAVTGALVMAAGGKVNFGIASEMDGTLRPDVMKQLEMLGDWYQDRRLLFQDAEPARGTTPLPEGLKLSGRNHVALHSRQGRDSLLHLFDLEADGSAPAEPLVVELTDEHWPNIERAVLEPSQETVWIDLDARGVRFEIPPAQQDPIDTIVRIEFE